jgi:hypothetical protein
MQARDFRKNFLAVSIEQCSMSDAFCRSKMHIVNNDLQLQLKNGLIDVWSFRKPLNDVAAEKGSWETGWADGTLQKPCQGLMITFTGKTSRRGSGTFSGTLRMVLTT